MMKSPEDEFEFKIARLSLGLGDALVAQSDRPIATEAASRLRAAIERVLPKTKVLIIPHDVTLTVASKAEVKKLEPSK